MLSRPARPARCWPPVANGDMWLMNADGSQAAVLVPQAHNLNSISSCGDRYVLFDSYRNGKIELWRVDADGSNGKKLADNSGRFPLFARWKVGLLRQQGQDLSHAGRRW